MTDRILAALLARLLRLIASDPALWQMFRRDLLKVVQSDAEQSRMGALAVAKRLEAVYNQDMETEQIMERAN